MTSFESAISNACVKRDKALTSGLNSSRSDASNDTFSITSSTIDMLRNELQALKEVDAPMPIYKRLPIIWAPFMSRRRLVQLVVCADDELKAGLIEEYTQHILVDALLLIISCTPLLSTADVVDKRTALVLSVYFLTVVIQLCSLVCGVIWITTFIQIKTEVFQEWVAERVDGILIALRLHSLGFYCFLLALLLWPLCLYSYPFNVIVTVPGLLFLLMFAYQHGPIGGALLRQASPGVQLSYFPQDRGLRIAAERELDLIRCSSCRHRPLTSPNSDNCSSQTPTTSLELEEVLRLAALDNVTHQWCMQVMSAQGITTRDTLRKLVPADYHQMKIRIGDRIKIEGVL